MPSKVNTARIMLKVLGWIQIVVGIIVVIMGLFGGALIGTSGQEGSGAVAAIVGVWGIVAGIIAIAFGVIYLMTAKGVEEKKNWAKIVGIIVGILSLFSFPIGTILGIFILIGLMGEEANSWFPAS
jgi:drug/metabolite transporter (DMT)-like permease